jgi:stage III sporulation protein SpoIIIAA
MQWRQIVEIVMDLGRPPLARFPAGDMRLSEDVITLEDLQHAIDRVSNSLETHSVFPSRCFWEVACSALL